MATRLTADQVNHFREKGYLPDLAPVYTPQEMAEHRGKFQKFLTHLNLDADENPKDTREPRPTARAVLVSGCLSGTRARR